MSAAAHGRILVADDDAAVRRTIARALEDGDFRLVEAADGGQAVLRADEKTPDLVLLDWTMPVLSGLEVLRRLRASWRTRLTPIVLLTGRSRVEDKELGLVSGADDYIVKPFSVRELRARVESHLARSRDRRLASPLTGLPGAAAFEQEIARRLAGAAPFAVLHADIDRFKAFNDAYGLSRGDDAIRGAASCALEAARRHGGAGALVAHVGGDDFGLALDAAHAERTALDLCLRFDAWSPRAAANAEEEGARDLSISVGGTLALAPGRDTVESLCARAARAKARLKASPAPRSRYVLVGAREG